MPVTVARLRRWFAIAAISLILVVAGFYYYGRMRIRRVVAQGEAKLGIDIQQTSRDFSLSRAVGGRTLFTIRASHVQQYKPEQGGRAELRDVTIVVYGRQSNRYDQIYGDEFEYDPQSQTVFAKGVVHIDLEANTEGKAQPDQAPPEELKNPIHLKTSALTFNQKTGVAHTDQQVEFRIPQASGTAVGAGYDSKSNTLTLQSDVRIHAEGNEPADIIATHGIITKEPHRAVLDKVRVERTDSTLEADQATIFLRPDNSVDHILADGDVRASRSGTTAMLVRAPRADLSMGEKGSLRLATLSGGVSLDASGARPVQATAGRVLIDFGPQNKPDKIRAVEKVHVVQPPGQTRPGAQPQTVELDADALDMLLKNGTAIQQAETSGAAQIVLTQAAVPATPSRSSSGRPAAGQPETRTVITAGRFVAGFDHNRLQTVTGSPDSKIVSFVPGEPQRVSTSRALNAQFSPSGEISGVLQDGDFHYSEGQRSAWAERAQYNAADQMLVLSGSPRLVEGGVTTTADVLRFNRRTGDASAQGEVKTTYSDLKPQPGGALLATSDPVHITSQSMFGSRTSGKARYTGDARLWQGANIVQAPTIEFDREHRTVSALGGPGRVSTVFVQKDKSGNAQSPVNVTAARLDYVDGQRTARFQGGVVMKGSDATVMADRLDVFLQPRSQNSPIVGPSQVDHAVAEGRVLIQEPNRRANGGRLVYTASQSKFVLTGGPPSIFDAEHGTITGDSLTFFSHDDRVLVEGKTSPTVTHTRVAK